jgi:hypothetical protein
VRYYVLVLTPLNDKTEKGLLTDWRTHNFLTYSLQLCVPIIVFRPQLDFSLNDEITFSQSFKVVALHLESVSFVADVHICIHIYIYIYCSRI